MTEHPPEHPRITPEEIAAMVAEEEGVPVEGLSEMMPPAEGLTTEGELPEEVAEEWRQRLRAQIDQELGR